MQLSQRDCAFEKPQAGKSASDGLRVECARIAAVEIIRDALELVVREFGGSIVHRMRMHGSAPEPSLEMLARGVRRQFVSVEFSEWSRRAVRLWTIES